MPRKREPAPPSRTIRVDDEVYKFLQEHAEALTDSTKKKWPARIGPYKRPRLAKIYEHWSHKCAYCGGFMCVRF